MKYTIPLIFCGAWIASASALPPDTVLATKGKHVARVTDVAAAIDLLPEEQLKKLKDAPTQWPPVLEEALVVKEWFASDLRSALTAQERAAVQYKADTANLRAGMDAYMNRAIRSLLSDADRLDRRAKELWAADEQSFNTPEAADVVVLYIDAAGRGLAAASARYQAIARHLKRGSSLESLVPKYADIVPGQKERLSRMRIERRNIDGAARRAIFQTMKPGQISGPIPVPEGWLVVQLVTKYPPTKRPFEEVRERIHEQLIQDAAKEARLLVMDKLNEVPVVLSEHVQPSKEDLATRLAAQRAANLVSQELRDRKITLEQAGERIRELMQTNLKSPTSGNPLEAPMPAPSQPVAAPPGKP